MIAYLSSCRRPPQSRAGGAARVIWLLILWHRTVLFFFIFFDMHVILSSLCYAFSARHLPPSRDCRLCHLPISCWFSPFFVSPPRHAGGPREGFDVGFPHHSACIFLQSPFFVSPPPATLAVRGRFDDNLPYHSACVFLQLLFFAFFLAS